MCRLHLELQEGESSGLQGMTEAGVTREQERKLAAKSQLIEKVNELFGDLALGEDFVVTSLDQYTSIVADDEKLKMQARNNTKADFAFSPHLVERSGDGVWSQQMGSAEFSKRLQELEQRELVSLLLANRLYERLRGEAS